LVDFIVYNNVEYEKDDEQQTGKNLEGSRQTWTVLR
jgi:hypothetical protein